MEHPLPAPITPEQLAALQQGNGYAELRDPATDRQFFLIEQVEPTIDDEYVRAKLAEGIAASERGDVAAWDVEAVRAELHRRIAEKRSRA